MENKVTLKNNKWVWPIIDENSWEGQNNSTELPNKIIPYLKSKKLMVQAGGNCGFLLNTFVDHFDTIYTFEPDPVNFYCLNHLWLQILINLNCSSKRAIYGPFLLLY